MLQQAFSLSFPILSFMFSFISVSTANSNVYVQCSQLNLTSMAPYESNVKSLFSSIINSASIYNFNEFETSPQSHGVYGLFQCRGDLSSSHCKECVVSAVNQLKTACPTSTGGEIQLEGCFVKYDNTSFFGAQDKMEMCKRCGPSIGYNLDVLNRIEDALGHLLGVNGEYFRGGDFRSIQGVAQCVQDLSLNDCQDCLLEAHGRLRTECETSTWGDMYLGKCYIRYAYQGNVNLANNGNPTSNGSHSGTILLQNVVALASSLLSLGISILSFMKARMATKLVARNVKKKKKAQESEEQEKLTGETVEDAVEAAGDLISKTLEMT